MTSGLESKLRALLALPAETEWVEFKHNNDSPQQIGEYLSALSNSAALHGRSNGWIVWGIEDGTRRIVGTQVDLKKKKGKGNEDLEPWLAHMLQPRVDFVIHPTLALPEGNVVMVEVPAATTAPVCFDRVAYIRVGSHKKPLLEHPEKARKIWALQQAHVDPSARPVEGATLEDLDPAERARLRQFIESNAGDRALLDLSDEELDGALGLTTRSDGARVPTLTGLLLIGRESRMRELVPVHEVAFQVLEGEEVRINEFKRWPLLRAFEWIESVSTGVNVEDEVQDGLFRVAVPRVDKRAFRESVANALVHRDYAKRGAVHVRFDSESLTISNPGGFVDGVSISNLLTTEPRPRNPSLADAMKRLGLVERTGRGVDLIYRGLLRFGRPRPDYTSSNDVSVVLRISTSAADIALVKLVIDEEKRSSGRALPVDSLIALQLISERRRVTKAEVAEAIQRDQGAAAKTLEALVERGLVRASGNTSGRTYTLSALVYAAQGQPEAYARQAELEERELEALVVKLARDEGLVRRSDVMALCRLDGDQASKLLSRLVANGQLLAEGKKRGRIYTVPKTYAPRRSTNDEK